MANAGGLLRPQLGELFLHCLRLGAELLQVLFQASDHFLARRKATPRRALSGRRLAATAAYVVLMMPAAAAPTMLVAPATASLGARIGRVLLVMAPTATTALMLLMSAIRLHC
jgi:hypothetical protein